MVVEDFIESIFILDQERGSFHWSFAYSYHTDGGGVQDEEESVT
jgi:hypothetical protein